MTRLKNQALELTFGVPTADGTGILVPGVLADLPIKSSQKTKEASKEMSQMEAIAWLKDHEILKFKFFKKKICCCFDTERTYELYTPTVDNGAVVGRYWKE